jgi:sigma-B regulation protein RsbU (phosphoserine phosphatase)
MLRVFLVRAGLTNQLRDWLDRKFFREAYDTELILSELADRARSITDPAKLIETVLRRVSEVLHVPQTAVLLRRGAAFRLEHAIGLNTNGAVALTEDSAPLRELVRTNSPAILYRERPDDWFTRSSVEEQKALEQMHAEVLLPLAGRSKLMGVMVLGSKRSEEAYSSSDLRLLGSVGAQTGLGLEVSDLAASLAEEASRRERIQREIEIAREVQHRLFPQCIPDTPGVDLAGDCRPALAVGGDYFDAFELEDERLAIAIGDVSGKGIGAALLMASLRASLRGISEDGAGDLARMMRKLNRLVYDSSTPNRYATFFFGIYDPRTRSLRYVNAGHNPPFVLRDGEQARGLEACGPVIGLLPDIAFSENVVQLACRDIFLAYTDGISEAMTPDDEEWGEERMIRAASHVKNQSAREILQAIMDAADRFTAGAPQHDDMTLLVLKLQAVRPCAATEQ